MSWAESIKREVAGYERSINAHTEHLVFPVIEVYDGSIRLKSLL